MKVDKKQNKQNKRPNKLVALFKKIQSSYTVQMNERPIIMTIVFLLLVNIAIIFVAGSIAYGLRPVDPHNPDVQRFDGPFAYFWALVTAVTWLFSPNAVLVEFYDYRMLALAIVAILTGMVLFTGTIVATVTTSLRKYVNTKADAKGKLILDNHIVILNYNIKVSAMLLDLLYTGIDDTVLILSDKSKDYIKAQLAMEKASLKDDFLRNKPTSKLKLIVRQGNPSSLAELKDICIEKARGILIVDPSITEADGCGKIGTADFNTIKLVMKLASLNLYENCPIGVEADTYKTAKMIKQLHKTIDGLTNKNIQAFSHNRKLGQFLALSIICPPLCSVITDLLTYEGPMFKPIDKIEIDDFLKTHYEGIPIIAKEKTYIISSKKCKTAKLRKEPYSTDKRLSPSLTKPRQEKLNIVVIGKNSKINYMLDALATQKDKMTLTRFGTDEILNFAQHLRDNADENTVAVILSDDTAKEEQYDSNVFLTLIELSNCVDLQTRNFKIVVELLEPDNQTGIEKFNVESIIVSTRIISFFATKLLSDPIAEKFYEDVFAFEDAENDDGFDILVDNAKALFDFNGKTKMQFNSAMEFIHAAYYGLNKSVMPIGKIENKQNIFFCDNLENPNFEIKDNEDIIYVRYNF